MILQIIHICIRIIALTSIFPSRIRSTHPASIFYPDCGRTMKTLFPSTSEMYIILKILENVKSVIGIIYRGRNVISSILNF